ncbi:MAG: transposase [Clostridia bacterium]|nr:transposase [Clostridia bacterium]
MALHGPGIGPDLCQPVSCSVVLVGDSGYSRGLRNLGGSQPADPVVSVVKLERRALVSSGLGEKTRKVLYINPSLETGRPRGLKAAMETRKVVERVFGDAKKWHGMGRARYRGQAKVAIQVIMTMMVVNAKRFACGACLAAG